MKKIFFLLISACLSTVLTAQTNFKKQFKTANVTLKNNTLTVSTGKLQRTWQITPSGLATRRIVNKASKKEWVKTTNHACDWAYYGLIEDSTKAKFLNIQAIVSSDSGFTAEHLLIELEFEYPSVETFVKYQIRVYPGAEGIYTRVGFKGNASKYVQRKPVAQGIRFTLAQGTDVYDYETHGFTKDFIADYSVDPKKVEYFIEGLNKNKAYKIGVSWWDFKGWNTQQKLVVASTDGEVKHELMPPQAIPNFKKDKAPYEERLFDLPQETLIDGSFRLTVEKIAGENATIAEIWLLEKGDNNYPIMGNIDRVAGLRQQKEAGWSLAAYRNCGERNAVETNNITGRVDFLPANTEGCTRRYIGYYNDTQHRNKPETPLLKEVVFDKALGEKEHIEWASVLFLEDKNEALTVVKENHKCVNQYGYDTGDFEVSKNGIANTGTALAPNEILPNTYRYAWATWVIAGKNGTDEREMSLKRFERQRFPVNPKTDIYIIANTWGSDRAAEAAKESNVLVEMEVQKELGIDVQQIDDGYQKAANAKQGDPNKSWYPHPDRYPEGFKNVKAKAQELDLKLGLWFAAMPVSLKEMKDNYEAGGFSYYKLDFAVLRNHQQMESMIAKIRAYELYTNHQSKVNWDVTEHAPRFGYFWAKEYGCVFLENRKPHKPENAVYVPHLVLRDLWHLSKYCNLNKFQGSVQNKDRVHPDFSDAHRHSHAYTVAIPLMSTPLFFQETQFYSQAAREEIKPVLATYRSVREDMYASYVFPIGEEPNNAHWSGFQAHHAEQKMGFLTVFREIENTEVSKKIQLRFAAGKTLRFTNLMTKAQFSAKADAAGFVEFRIEKAGDFQFLKYTYLSF